MTDPKRLYDEDFVLWSQHQAEALRAASRDGGNGPLDWENLAEEIESLGISQRTALRRQIRRIIRHLIKLQCSLANDPHPGWKASIRDARGAVQDLLQDSPSLASEIPQIIAQQTSRTLREVIVDLEDYGELAGSWLVAGKSKARQDLFRFAEDQVLGDWFPPQPQQQGGAA
ncbi:MAG TPA: DUF29 domain-containing protein [Stellaceae bacterium]|nr:DUF29 domain-containing protein [Stellaceae bacterium]